MIAMSDTSEMDVLNGTNRFANNMYKVLSQDEGNLIFSPLSAHAALSMVYQGAANETASVLSSTLQVTEPKATANGYKHLLTRLNALKTVQLSIANKIYLKHDMELLDAFERTISEHFLSEVEPVNFGESLKTVDTINNWVSHKTNDKIKQLLLPGDISSATALVLINAIYFKGQWMKPFHEKATRTEQFYVNKMHTIEVDMMHLNKERLRYKNDKELQAQVLELPYKECNMSMIIILPHEVDGLQDVEKKLNANGLISILSNMQSASVNVALPKFKIEKQMNLEDTLTQMGLGNIFDSAKANFSRIFANENQHLHISKVIQKAFIEVNEFGSEAAAATGIVMLKMSLTQGTVEVFYANHPFMFILLEQQNILFTGRVSTFED